MVVLSDFAAIDPLLTIHHSQSDGIRNVFWLRQSNPTWGTLHRHDLRIGCAKKKPGIDQSHIA
jgi:hypothetical protein